MFMYLKGILTSSCKSGEDITMADFAGENVLPKPVSDKRGY